MRRFIFILLLLIGVKCYGGIPYLVTPFGTGTSNTLGYATNVYDVTYYSATNVNVVVVTGGGQGATVNQNYYLRNTNAHGVIWTNAVNSTLLVQSNADFYPLVGSQTLWDLENAAGSTIYYDNDQVDTPFALWAITAGISSGTAPPPTVTPLFTTATNTLKRGFLSPTTNATVYVDGANGSDSSGSRGIAQLPFKTIFAGNNATKPGDTLEIAPGRYDMGAYCFRPTNLTIKAWGAYVSCTSHTFGVIYPIGTNKIYGGSWTNNADDRGGLITDVSTNLLMQGVTIGGSIDGLHGTVKPGEFNHFENCTFYSYWDGIVIGGSEVSPRGTMELMGCTVICTTDQHNNDINNAGASQGYHGITLQGMDGFITGCRFYLKNSALVSTAGAIVTQNALDYIEVCGTDIQCPSTNNAHIYKLNQIAGTIKVCGKPYDYVDVLGAPTFEGASGGGVAASGSVALVGGKATITTAFAHVTNAITLSEYSPNATNAVLNVSNIVANTSFQIISSVTGDTNRVSYVIVKP